MIEIKCAAAETLALCRQQGIDADNIWEMTERGNLLGFSCVVRGEGTAAQISRLQAPDTPLTDALLRATLNALRADGVRSVLLVDENLKKHVGAKGYLPYSSEMRLEIDEFFSKSVCKG